MCKQPPEQFGPEEILQGLKTKVMGRNLIFHPVLNSTNDLAKELASQGVPEGTVVVADAQTSGKGRRGRSWVSQVGQGVWMSVVLRPQINPTEANQITILAAVAVVKAIEQVCGLQVGIKWPNDIVCQGKKLTGILLEMSTTSSGLNHIILGIGTNITIRQADFPEELQEKATSLLELTGNVISRVSFIQAVLQELETGYSLVGTQRFQAVMEAWRRASVTIGAEVIVEDAGVVISGLAVDIDQQGALLLRRADGEAVKVLSGDVSLRYDNGAYVK